MKVECMLNIRKRSNAVDIHYRFPKRQCIRHWLRSLDLPDIQCLGIRTRTTSTLTEIHDVISTDGAVVNYNVYR